VRSGLPDVDQGARFLSQGRRETESRPGGFRPAGRRPICLEADPTGGRSRLPAPNGAARCYGVVDWGIRQNGLEACAQTNGGPEGNAPTSDISSSDQLGWSGDLGQIGVADLSFISWPCLYLP